MKRCAQGASCPIHGTNYTIDLGNNESITRGVVGPDADGSFLALTGTQSRTFKTRAGAERWLARRGIAADGRSVPS